MTKDKTIQDKVYFLSSEKCVKIEEEKLFLDNGEIQLLPDQDIETQAKVKSREIYTKIIQQPYENLLVLTGAGSSIGFGGKTMTQLWDEIIGSNYNDLFTKTKYKSSANKNLEDLLSHIYKVKDVIDDSEIASVESDLKKIQDGIRDACNFKIERKDLSTHIKFLKSLSARKLKYSRLKLFTLNYDLLFERAAEEGKFIVINGFNFAYPHNFDGNIYDYDIVIRENSRTKETDNYVNNVFHLYKPHGSINWFHDEKVNQVYIKENNDNAYMVYPNNNKFEISYEQPFFEMTSRFQRYLRTHNTLLICIGFSFNDKHYSNMITEAIKANPSLTVLIVNRTLGDTGSPLEAYRKMSESYGNLFLVSETFQDFVDQIPYPPNYYLHEPNE